MVAHALEKKKQTDRHKQKIGIMETAHGLCPELSSS